jgi:iron complex outermembrane recepter protein
LGESSFEIHSAKCAAACLYREYLGENQVKKTQTLRPLRPLIRSRGYAVSSTAVGCTILLMAAGSAARAADTDPTAAAAAPGEPVEEVVVTGIRAAIESAISAKKKSDDIEETLSAEDIGKLPDTTIAESLARLPGVTTQRDSQGNATSISIRGLGPDFNGYLMNGREQTSTLDSRAVDLQVYPAELISGATVYKSGDASLMTAGLAGTIDQRLIDPLSYDHLITKFTWEDDRLGAGVPEQPTGKGDRWTLSFIDQFADRKLGVAVGFVHQGNDSSTINDSTWGSGTFTNVTNAADQSIGPATFINGFNYATYQNTNKLDGGAAIIKFAPNESLSSEIDYYYAKKDVTQHITEAQASLSGSAITDATIVNGNVDTGTILMPAYDEADGSTYGVIDRNEAIFNEETLESFGWNTALQFSDTWRASIDINHNQAINIERDIETYATVDTADALSFTNGSAAVGGGIPQLTLATPYTSPATLFVHDIDSWSGTSYPLGSPYYPQGVPQAGYSKGPTITDKLTAIRLDFTHDLSNTLFSKLQFGGNYSDRSKYNITDEGVIISTQGAGYGDIPLPAATVLNGVGGTGLSFLSFVPGASLWPGATVLSKYNNQILGKTWEVFEKVTTVYGKLDINTNWFGIPVRGNVGAQWVFTNQSSSGFNAQDGTGVTLSNPAASLTTKGTTYSDFLPSLNLVGDFGSGNLLRFAAAEEIARPEMDFMANSLAVSYDTTAPAGTIEHNTDVGTAGNPYLKPFKALAVDLSYEKYFQNKAYFSGALFYKWLNTYITPYTNYGGYDFSKIGPELGLTEPPLPAGWNGTFTDEINGHGGNLRGVELAASLPFSMVASWLDGFGISGSYSSTLSSVVVPNTIGFAPGDTVTVNETMGLPNLSHINDKIIFYFEKWGFSTFIADNHRSEYIGSVPNTTVGGYPSLVYILPQTWVSAQAGYEVQSGWFKGLAIRFEGNNLNKPKYQTIQTFGGPVSTTQTGENYDLRFIYKFE